MRRFGKQAVQNTDMLSYQILEKPVPVVLMMIKGIQNGFKGIGGLAHGRNNHAHRPFGLRVEDFRHISNGIGILYRCASELVYFHLLYDNLSNF